MKSTSRIFLTPGRFDKRRGQRYNVIFDGEQIVTDAIDAEYAACRVLAARGVTGRLETWRTEAAHASMVIHDIEDAAKLTVRENRAQGPSVIRYQSFVAGFARWGNRPLPTHLGNHRPRRTRDGHGSPSCEPRKPITRVSPPSINAAHSNRHQNLTRKLNESATNG